MEAMPQIPLCIEATAPLLTAYYQAPYTENSSFIPVPTSVASLDLCTRLVVCDTDILNNSKTLELLYTAGRHSFLILSLPW